MTLWSYQLSIGLLASELQQVLISCSFHIDVFHTPRGASESSDSVSTITVSLSDHSDRLIGLDRLASIAI